MNKYTKQGKVGVYTWELPIRWSHWINALSITILIITGLYIGRPFVIDVDPSIHVMGWIRVIHFIAAYVFTAHLLLRVYWMIVGNKYAKSNPLRLSFWREVWETIKYYLFIGKKEHGLGHNPLAQVSYWVFMGLGGAVMILTGFAMEGQPYSNTGKGGWLEWLSVMLGPSDVLHYVHHLGAWAFVVFVIIHLYLVFREELTQSNGEISSMISGYKYVDESVLHEEEQNHGNRDIGVR